MTERTELVRERWTGVVDGPALSRRVSMLYAAVYIHYGVYTIFMPIWFQRRGLSSSEIGILLALPLFLRVLFVAPVTALADRLRRIRELQLITAVSAAILIAAIPLVHGFPALLVFFTVFAVVWDPLPILTDAYASAAVRARNIDFGRARVWGTIGVLVSAMTAGTVIDRLGIGAVPLLTAALLLAPACVIPFLPPDRLFGDPVKANKGEWRTLVRDRQLMWVLGGVALILGSNQLIQSFGAIQWTAKGMSAQQVGLLIGVAGFSEIVVLVAVQKSLGLRSPVVLLLIGAVATTIRWGLMATNPGFVPLIALQSLQGICAMTTIAGSILYIARRVPTHLAGTANGINAVLGGITMGIVTFLAGQLWDMIGPLAYLFTAAMTLLAALIFLILLRNEAVRVDR